MTTMRDRYKNHGVHPETIVMTGAWMIPFVIKRQDSYFPSDVLDEIKAKIAADPYGELAAAYMMGMHDGQSGKNGAETSLLAGDAVEERSALKLMPASQDPGTSPYIRPDLAGQPRLTKEIIDLISTALKATEGQL